jgi:hypothetical protein
MSDRRENKYLRKAGNYSWRIRILIGGGLLVVLNGSLILLDLFNSEFLRFIVLLNVLIVIGLLT